MELDDERKGKGAHRSLGKRRRDRQKSRRFRSHRNKGESEKPVRMGAGRSST